MRYNLQAPSSKTSAKDARPMWRALTAGLLAAAFYAAAVLAPSPAQAQEPTLRHRTPFPAMNLKAHERGEAAIQALGARLPEVSKWYGKTPEEFAATLRRDKHARIDRAGRMYYVDEFPAATTTASGGSATIGGALLPADQTFKLHSRPGAQRVIYLDFNGHLATGTAWNNAYDLSAIDAPAFDFDGNPAAFSTAELERIQYIWQRVAEDYAPFDVDVTTEEPPADAMARSSTSDVTFGTRVVVTADWTASTANPCGCGGFAYVGVFDDTTEYYKPAYVFYNRLGSGNEKYVAEAISHEVGHNLGLSHDGQTGGSAYYQGHGSGATGWAPIMGVGYYKELVQWSKGEYTNANNTEDDLARIPMFGAPLRADDHGDTFAAATPLTASAGTLSGDGVIGTRADVDVFSFSSGAGAITLNIGPAARSANLDLQAELYDASGTLVASANPVDALNAGIAVSNANAGTYYLKIDGIGKGDLATGYSDYGSLGQYAVSGSAPAASGQPPVAIASATPTSGTAPLTVNFNGGGSYDPDGGALSYSWNFGDGSAGSTEANPAHVYSAAGNYTATLTVTDPSGAAAFTQILITVAGAAPTLHVEAIGMSLSIKRNGTRATATVTITDASGKALSGATVSGSWSGVVSGTSSTTTGATGKAKLSSPFTKSRGTFTFTVTGVSLSGYTYDAAQNKLGSASIVY
mgnify:CR=1 FL=1